MAVEEDKNEIIYTLPESNMLKKVGRNMSADDGNLQEGGLKPTRRCCGMVSRRSTSIKPKAAAANARRVGSIKQSSVIS